MKQNKLNLDRRNRFVFLNSDEFINMTDLLHLWTHKTQKFRFT